MRTNLLHSILAVSLFAFVFCASAGASPKPKVLLPSVEIGIIDFVSSDYGNYAPEEVNFMDLNAKSLSVAVSIVGGWAPITRDGKLGLESSLGIAWDNYVFANKLTIEKVDGVIRPVAIDPKYKKSKFNTFSFKMPLMLNLSLNKIGISGGVYGKMIISQHTKYKHPKHKEKGLNYMNLFQGGVAAEIKFKGIGVFASYALTDFFRHSAGPDLHPLTVGISIW